MALKTVIIVHEKDNPSTDFYLRPLFPADTYQLSYCRFGELVSAEALTGAVVVFVRYLPRQWLNFVQAHRHKIDRLVLFIDDDLLDFSATSGLPLTYRLKVWWQITSVKAWLGKLNIKLWVSTPYLLQKYRHYAPVLVESKPISPLQQSICVFYHGSITHHAEIEWLLPVMEQVLARNKNVYFELIGNSEVYAKLRHLDRVVVVNLMSWTAYQHFIQRSGRHIGLVPLLVSPFNQARSMIKFYDVTSAHAVGIYARDTEVGRFVQHNKDGVLVDMVQEEWISAIIELAEDENRRGYLLSQAQYRLMTMNEPEF